MFHYGHHPLYHQPGVPQPTGTAAYLRSDDVSLDLRQEPKEALLTVEGKEKMRKPVDPPPIIQLFIKHHADPAQHFLQSPYLFMCASLFSADKNEEYDGKPGDSLAGCLVSSLHRLKDIDNKDGGFFVFGDISVKVQGTFRLKFSLFELHKTPEIPVDVTDNTNTRPVVTCHFLASVISNPFNVLPQKDFKGLEESTYLSRAFSDQGVRLRLRKEPRAMVSKRPYGYASVDQTVPNTPVPRTIDHAYYADEIQSPMKRFRTSDPEEPREKVEFSEQPTIGFSSSFVHPQAQQQAQQFPVRQPGISGYPPLHNYGFGIGSEGSSPLSYRTTSVGGTSNLSRLSGSTDSSGLQTPAVGSMTPSSRYPDLNFPGSSIGGNPYGSEWN